ncbi:hypothetical protein, partial [Streptomyces ardesiacus]|uniref:hypothetical protein n=1 Tax=Streptomyces ardesiacus TaxID=285564 RepID=UPI002FDC04DC
MALPERVATPRRTAARRRSTAAVAPAATITPAAVAATGPPAEYAAVVTRVVPLPALARTGPMGRPRVRRRGSAGSSGTGHSDGQARTGDGRACAWGCSGGD